MKTISFSIPVLVLSMTFTLSVSAMQALPENPPIPASNPMNSAKVQLGKMLYFDKRLSADNSVSCNTCHDANKGGVDGLPTSKGIKGQHGNRNSPSVWNAAYLSVQFWDGRAPSLEEQAKGPLINPVEMGMKDHAAVVAKVKGIPGYLPHFESVYGKGDTVTIDHIAQAIAAYERTLVTPNSPFDRYMRGDKKAMNAGAVRGFQKFQEVGCASCHSGPTFAGPSLPEGTGFFMKFPTMPNTDYDKKYELSKDLGRFEVTKNAADKNMFRVAPLRNIALTAPYFHNGKVSSLDEAVRVMAKAQLGRDLKKDETADIVSFLKALSGSVPKQVEPTLPQ